ncbi:MAG: lytic transglycosylase domain-containing protein [Thermoleophilia bacterium]|nr:lytic transglycosylase domain-containing protein [Thermoleophilia bacterium]
MRALAALATLLALAGAAAGWVVTAEPGWYLRARYPLRYEAAVHGTALRHRLAPSLVAAVVYAESEFDPQARSSAGALGLMQLLPTTAEGIALHTGGERFVVPDLFDPALNLSYGTWYLRSLLDRYGDVPTALAAYHAGPGNVDRWRAAGEEIGFPETRAYVEKVLRLERVYAEAWTLAGRTYSPSAARSPIARSVPSNSTLN